MKKKRGRPSKQPQKAWTDFDLRTARVMLEHEKSEAKKKKPILGFMYPSSVEMIDMDNGIWEVRLKENPTGWQRFKSWFTR